MANHHLLIFVDLVDDFNDSCVFLNLCLTTDRSSFSIDACWFPNVKASLFGLKALPKSPTMSNPGSSAEGHDAHCLWCEEYLRLHWRLQRRGGDVGNVQLIDHGPWNWGWPRHAGSPKLWLFRSILVGLSINNMVIKKKIMSNKNGYTNY